MNKRRITESNALCLTILLWIHLTYTHHYRSSKGSESSKKSWPGWSTIKKGYSEALSCPLCEAYRSHETVLPSKHNCKRCLIVIHSGEVCTASPEYREWRGHETRANAKKVLRRLLKLQEVVKGEA